MLGKQLQKLAGWGRGTRGKAGAQCRHDGCRDGGRALHAGQWDKVDALGKKLLAGERHLNRQPRLANATRPNDAQQAIVWLRQPLLKLLDLLLATDKRADYERKDKPNTFRPFLSGEDLEDVTIAGQGVIDGAGAAWWGDAEEARRKKPGYTLPRPNLIVLERVTNLVVRDVTIQNSPKFHLVPTDCDGVTITGVTILAPEGAANTDAIDPSMCRHVTITKCFIDVGDDNIAIKSGKKAKGREFACEDITVADCTFKHGHGMSIGSETVGGVRNVRVKHCTFEDTDNGLRIKSDRTRGGRVEDIIYEDIRMTNVRGAITITCYYPKVPDKDNAQPVGATTPKYKNLMLRNVQGTSSQAAGIIVGLPESQIENVTLDNVSIVAAKTGLEIRNARGVSAKGLSVVAKSGEPIIVRDAEVIGIKK